MGAALHFTARYRSLQGLVARLPLIQAAFQARKLVQPWAFLLQPDHWDLGRAGTLRRKREGRHEYETKREERQGEGNILVNDLSSGAIHRAPLLEAHAAEQPLSCSTVP